jgi:hypothetical protein
VRDVCLRAWQHLSELVVEGQFEFRMLIADHERPLVGISKVFEGQPELRKQLVRSHEFTPVEVMCPGDLEAAHRQHRFQRLLDNLLSVEANDVVALVRVAREHTSSRQI